MNFLWTPTLCASATVVGVSAVGFAFGRQDYHSPVSHPNTAPTKRKQSSEPTSRLMPPDPSQAQRARTAHGSSSNATTPSPSADNTSSRPPSRLSNDGRTRTRKARRMTVADAPALKRQEVERAEGSASEDVTSEFGARLTLRTRPSWMKRLSAMSSRSTSPSPSPRPESPAVAASFTSAGFSQSGSTVPMVGSRPSPLPPNKLVKRTSSQRIPFEPPPGARRPTLRRPATSHQRLGNLHALTRITDYHHPETVESEPEDALRRSERHETRWRQYFNVKVSRRGTVTRKRNSSGDTKGIRRILPDSRYFPTLITAKSVLTSSFDVEDYSSSDVESILPDSRPHSAFGFEHVVLMSRESGPTSPRDVPGKSNANGGTQEGHEDSAPARRSFSFHDLLPLGSRRPSSSKGNKPFRLTRKAGRRAQSEPLVASSRDPSASPPENKAKRRDITDPGIFHIDIPRAQGDNDDARNTHELNASLGPLPSPPLTFASSFHSKSSHLEGNSRPTSRHGYTLGPLTLDQMSHSPILPQASLRPSNYSTAPSEQTSTLVGSDTEARGVNSGDESDVDYGSETVFDSIRTRGARSTSGPRKPRIESIFDEASTGARAMGSTFHDAQPSGLFSDPDMVIRKSHDIIEEEESVGTPVRTVRSDRADNGSPTARRVTTRSPFPPSLTLTTSQPDMPKPLSLGTLEYDDPLVEEDEESRWSCFDEQEHDGRSIEGSDDGWARITEGVSTPTRLTPNLLRLRSSLSHMATTPLRSDRDSDSRDSRRETRSHLFDWSEQPTEKSPGSGSPQRPKTVHGKKDTDRGSRSVGRRAPSGLHARSQSVPVVPDIAGKRDTVITNKFGTWGVGSKGVSEDWDDDFDFGEKGMGPVGPRDEKRIDSGVAMHIPQTIRERQANVMTNIGLIREFGLLIEELKSLRRHAVTLGLLERPGANVWVQIDSMIDLADQDAEDPVAPNSSPPSSPILDDSFDEQADGAGEFTVRKAGRITGRHDPTPGVIPSNARNRRKSVLPTDDVFSVDHPQPSKEVTKENVAPIITRPRKDSEAMARSVIEALQKRRGFSSSEISLHPAATSKNPVKFGTDTLRHIVPYVNNLVYKAKDQIRDAEGFDLSREPSPKRPELHDPAFSQQLFKTPTSDSPSSRKGRQSRSSNNALSPPPDDGLGLQGIDDITAQTKLMTVM
ncbi:hypothetical protein EJ06DRAFT_385546 [Trichodelitschia bisporula]|uniref:Uncharacterized protein n=1 Tax=Trichodelitschia bisporula TaxID=703511 RepID=A0A6G1HZ44_9PEZI|nr:hypothetical protein EJ06DRAFT_385546 [Trichodelitschia bisporula]